MAFDLVARLRLKDNLSPGLRKAAGEGNKLKTTMDYVTKATDKMDRAVQSVGRAITRMSSVGKHSIDQMRISEDRASVSFRKMGDSGRHAMDGIRASGTGTLRSIVGLTAGIGGAIGAAKLFDDTIGAAAKAQYSRVTIKGMFAGDTKSADAYFKMIQKRAVVSQFSSEDFFATAKPFVAVTKDIGNLTKLTNLAERLAAMDPVQGLEGAAVALRELASGDTTSLAERFEIPRSTLNVIKNLPIKDQIKAMDLMLNKMGFSNKLLEEQSKTALSQYGQAVDKVKIALQNMGTKGLAELEPSLRRLNAWLDSPSFTKFADKMADGFGSAFKNASTGANKLLAYFNDPKFKNLNFGEAVTVALSDFKTGFDTWMASDGDVMISSAAENIASTMRTVLGSQDNIEKMAEIGVKLGKSILSGIGRGLKEDALPTFKWEKPDWMKDWKNLIPFYNTGDKPAPKHAGGLDRVPYNGYPTLLHKDERVQTKGEADAMRSSRGGYSGGAVNITGNTFVVRQESDIESVALQLVRLMGQSEGARSIG